MSLFTMFAGAKSAQGLQVKIKSLSYCNILSQGMVKINCSCLYRGFQVGCQVANANTLGIVVIRQLDE